MVGGRGSGTLTDRVQAAKRFGEEDVGARDEPVGGHVMRNVEKMERIGLSTSSAYVMAKLTVMNGTGSFDESDFCAGSGGEGSDEMRLRTLGTMSHRHCPLRVMM